MLAACWPETIRKAQKVGLVDCIEHLHRRSLDDFVLQRRDPERSLPPIGLGDVRSPYRLGSVSPALQSMGEILQVFLYALSVFPPPLSIYTRRGFLLQSQLSRH